MFLLFIAHAMQQNTTDFIAKAAWETTKARWKEFMVLPLIVAAVTFGIMGFLASSGSGPAFFVVFILYIGFMVFMVAFSTAVTKWCSDLYSGAKEIDIEGGLRYGLSRFWGVVGTSLLTGLKVMLWALLLIIPGYYKGLMYSKSIKISQLEKISGGDANRISQKMVSEAGPLRTLGNMTAVGFVAVLVFYIYLALSALVGGLFMMAHEGLGLLIIGLLGGAGMVTLMTFMMVYNAYEYLIFRDETKAAVAPVMKALSSMK